MGISENLSRRYVKNSIAAIKNGIHFAWTTGDGKPYLKTKQEVYTVESHFIFRGTSVLGIPSAIKIIRSIKVGSPNMSIRIYDSTNSKIIAEETGISDTIPTLSGMGVLSNLPVGNAIFEIQGKIDAGAGKEGRLHTLNVQF